MKRLSFSNIILVLALLVGLAGSAAADSGNSWLGYYGQVYPLSPAETVPPFKEVSDLSNLRITLAEADIFQRGNDLYVDWLVTRNPPGRVIGAVSRVTHIGKDELDFDFENVWHSHGHGKFIRSAQGYTLDVEVAGTDNADLAAPVSNLFGAWKLEQQSTTPSDNRHPWSLGSGVRP